MQYNSLSTVILLFRKRTTLWKVDGWIAKFVEMKQHFIDGRKVTQQICDIRVCVYLKVTSLSIRMSQRRYYMHSLVSLSWWFKVKVCVYVCSRSFHCAAAVQLFLLSRKHKTRATTRSEIYTFLSLYFALLHSAYGCFFIIYIYT
jgi:hypothetical protein